MRAILTDNVRPFRVVISSASKIFPELFFLFERNEVSITGITPNHLTVMSCLLERDFFERYECGNEKTQASLDSATLEKVLSRVGSKLLIRTRDESFILETLDTPLRTFAVPIKKIWEVPPETYFREYSHKCSVEIPPPVFRQVISDCAVVSEEIHVLCKQNGIAFKAEGEMGEYTYGRADDPEEDAFVSVVMLRDVRGIAKLASISRLVRISTGKELPLLIEFLLAHAHVSFLVSSRS